jgi:hypothetical protein
LRRLTSTRSRAVDLVEARKVKAAQGGTLTAAGVASDVLGYAATTVKPVGEPAAHLAQTLQTLISNG